MLFFAFLVGITPISFAEEDSKKISWEKATLESKYFVHFQAQTRNADGSLVSVIETVHGEYLSDSRTDLAYSQLPLVDASAEILNKKYEMRQLVIPMGSIPAPNNIVSAFNIGHEIDGEYVAVFHAFPPFFLVEYSDIVAVQWTIFKKV
jgi:GTP:adenosylcobinamide-phosphate guanylyltransferase